MISFLLLLLGFGQGGHAGQARHTWKPDSLDVQPAAPAGGARSSTTTAAPAGLR